MSKMGKQITEDEVNASMRMHRLQNVNQIGFDEFKEIFAEDQNSEAASPVQLAVLEALEEEQDNGNSFKI